MGYRVGVSPRTITRLAALVAATGVTVLAPAAPALARPQDDGSEPGEGLTPLSTLIIFGVLPVALFLLIALLVAAGSIARGPRYRTDRAWEAEPASFGMPTHGVRSAPTAAAIEAGSAGEPEQPGGGVSATW